jgi:RHS repeat-associated protein
VYSNLTQIGVTNCTAGSLGIAVSATTNRIATTGYLFDATGNMTQEAAPNGYGYSYDAENRLTQATGTSTGTWTYVYDGNGMRVEKSNASGGTLYWRASAGAAIAETDLSGNITSEYAFFAGQRIARRDASNNVYYYYSDQVGSTTAITTASGAPCYEATFTPYGEEHNTVNTCPQNYKFTGYERDSETGLDYAFARYYNSRIGRFMSADPLSGDATDPQSLNRYAYVGNDATDYSDPSGMLRYPCRSVPNNCSWGDGFGDYGSDPGLAGAPISITSYDPLTWSDGEGKYITFPNPATLSWWPVISGGGGEAVGAWRRAAHFLSVIAKSRLLSANLKCANDLAALGTSEAAIAQGAANANIQNGVGSSVPMSSLYASSPTLGRLASTVPGTVGDRMNVTLGVGTVAVSQLNGNNIYLNPALINPGNGSAVLGDVFHEVVHNVTGLTDDDIQLAFPSQLATGVPSANISNRLLWDCF